MIAVHGSSSTPPYGRMWLIRTVLRTTIGAPIVTRQPQNVSNDRLLEFKEALIDFRTVASIIVECLHKGAFFTIDQDGDPCRHFVLLLCLEMVRPIVWQKTSRRKRKKIWSIENTILLRLFSLVSPFSSHVDTHTYTQNRHSIWNVTQLFSLWY